MIGYEIEFSGALHIWTSSELDLVLRVQDLSGRLLATDDISGGGDTPYIRLNVDKGNSIDVHVASKSETDLGTIELDLIAAPETDATLAAAMAGRDAMREARRLIREGDQAAARDLVEGALEEILGTPEATNSDAIYGALFDIGFLAHNETGSLSVRRQAWEWTARHCERILPEGHPNLLASRENLGASMMGMGDLAGARALFESVLAARERLLPADHPDLLAARSNLAVSMSRMGHRAGARALHESVLASCERTLPKDHPNLLRARGNLAGSMYSLGDLAGARALRESLLAAYERILPDDHQSLLLARTSLAISMMGMGDLAGARALFESVVAARERLLPAGHPDLVTVRGELASSMFAMGDLAEARALDESVVAARERRLPADHPDLMSARANLAVSMHAMGDHAGARELRESLLAAYERILPEDHADRLHIQANMAISMHAMGDLAGARALQESVLAAYERLLPASHHELLDARANLGISMMGMGDLAGARALLPAQLGGMRMRILASLALAPRQARQAVASEGSRHSAVLALTESAGPELERSAFELTETLRLVAAEADRSLSHFESDPELGPILNEAAEIRRSLNDLVAGAARDETGSEGLSTELTKLSLRRDALEREASRRLAERGIVTKPVGASALTARLEPGDVAVGFRRITLGHVDPSSGEVQPAADQLLAHVLDSEGTLNRIDLGPASELEELAASWRGALGAPILRGISLVPGEGDPELRTGRKLRARILDPVLASAGGETTRLFVCADDLLFLLPLDALPLDEGERGGASARDPGSERVGDRLRIVNEVSFARLLAPFPPADTSPSLLSLGGVDYDAEGAVPDGLVANSAPIEMTTSVDGVEPGTAESEATDPDRGSSSRSAMPQRFQNLLQARFEAEATAALFEEAFETEPALLTKEKTTKAALFEAAAGKRYLHLATHGWFASESVRSTEDAKPLDQGFARMGLEELVSGLAPMTLCGLALAGANRGRDSLGRVPGILTAEELCSLDLSRCELAVLSACETNVGIRRAGQGIQSLQTALYAAGARTSITSLWSVDDAATRRLMEVFYTNLWIAKMPKAEALWQAKQALRDEGHPPVNWAGWVLTGDPK